MGLGEPAVGVRNALVGEAFEEGVQVLVVTAHAPGLEAGRQEDGVHPVRLVIAQHRAHQLRCDPEPVAELLIGNGFTDNAFRKVERHNLVSHAQLHRIADAIADLIGLRHDRLELGT